MQHATTKHFRDFCFKKYPALQDNIDYAAFFNLICFSGFRDKENDYRLVISHDFICNELHKDPIHWRSGEFLKAFKKDVLPNFIWSEATDDKARQVIDCGFDDETILEHNEAIDIFSVPEVLFASGKLWNSGNRTANKKNVVVTHNSRLAATELNPTQKLIVDEMSKVDGVQFIDKLKENEARIVEELNKLDPTKRKIQERIIGSIREYSKIHYYPGNRTARLSAAGDTVVSLKGSIRRALTHGYTEFDLVSSQFAILAKILNAPLSKDKLNKNENIWQSFYLLTHKLNEIPPKHIKKIYKELLYGIAFGTTKKLTARHIKDNERRAKAKPPIAPIESLEQKLAKYDMTILLEHTIIKELLELRSKWFQQIKKDGGAKDVWGNFLSITKDTIVDGKKEKARWYGAVAASVIQSYELEIISAVFEAQKEHGKQMDFQINIFQHDGGTISIKDKSVEKLVIKRLSEAVETKAQSYGIKTTLEFERL